MVCQDCGMPCKGRRCSTCEDIHHQENVIGTPAEIREREEADDDG